MFEYVPRHYDETLVLVRGWAFDQRIFEPLDLPFNYLYYVGQGMGTFASQLNLWLTEHNIERLSLFGWSMGAYAVSDFAIRFPDKVREVYLVGARRHYPADEVAYVEKMLQRNPKGFMRKLYKDCFAGHTRELYRWFKGYLQPDYLQQWSVPELRADLDWIRAQELDTAALNPVAHTIVVHGLADRLAPEAEARDLVAGLPAGRAVLIEAAGHVPFLVENFRQRLVS
ncbi:alpha/beta fold hydrolase [Planctomycetota bacterium]